MSPTKFGYDYTFDCTGNVDVMRACLEVPTVEWAFDTLRDLC